jgi:gas vesicle structural protein
VTPRPSGLDRTGDPVDELSLAELVNRVLDKGVVITGDVTISVAGVDLVYLGLRVMLTSVETATNRTLAPGSTTIPPGSTR